MTLQELKKEMENIRGEWNGKESGQQEDRANISGDILEKIQEIEELLEDLGERYEPVEDIPQM